MGITRAIVIIDLVGYSSISEQLEQSSDVDAVTKRDRLPCMSAVARRRHRAGARSVLKRGANAIVATRIAITAC